MKNERSYDFKVGRKFLECFSCGEKVNIRIFSDKKGDGFKGKNISFSLDEFTNKCKILKAHNEADRGIFFVVNSGGNSDRYIKRINAQFFECDDLSFKEQWVTKLL